MLKRIGYYRSALVLASAIALIEVLFWYVLSGYVTSAALNHRVFVSFAIVFGLWVHSNPARYLGAIWFLATAGFVVWGFGRTGTITFSFGQICTFVSAALGLTAAWILLLSRQFADEFRNRRETEPDYKASLRNTVYIAAIAAVVILIAIDFFHFLRSHP
jgi:hypothetical protein